MGSSKSLIAWMVRTRPRARSHPIHTLTHAHAHTQQVDKLLCLGGSCSHNTMSHGVIAMVAVGAALLAVVLGLLAYLRSERRKQQAKTPAPTVDDFYA